MIFKVTPINRRTGVEAPAMLIEGERNQFTKASNEAKSRSGLGKFKSWDFHRKVIELK